MAKKSLVEYFEYKQKDFDNKELKDYDVFKNKRLLDELRSKIIQNIIDNKIPTDKSLSKYINDEIDASIQGYDLNTLERRHIFNLIENEIHGYGPITELL